MSFLTLGVTTGVLVLVFQDGRFESLLGYTSQRRDRGGRLPRARGDRVRDLDRLRRVRPRTDQGGARPRPLAAVGDHHRHRRDRPAGLGGRGPARRRDGRVRHVADRLPQGDRRRRRGRRPRRRLRRAGPAGAEPDGPAGRPQLVEPARAAPPARARRPRARPCPRPRSHARPHCYAQRAVAQASP